VQRVPLARPIHIHTQSTTTTAICAGRVEQLCVQTRWGDGQSVTQEDVGLYTVPIDAPSPV